MLTGRNTDALQDRRWRLRANLRSAAGFTLELGFTLLELMVVMTIIMILLGMAAARYERAIQSSREAVLKQDLHILREAIEQYTADKMAGPQSLEDLASPDSKYIREVPVDPMTQRKDWVTVFGGDMLTVDETTPGITDVHSASQSISPTDGKAYSTW